MKTEEEEEEETRRRRNAEAEPDVGMRAEAMQGEIDGDWKR